MAQNELRDSMVGVAKTVDNLFEGSPYFTTYLANNLGVLQNYKRGERNTGITTSPSSELSVIVNALSGLLSQSKEVSAFSHEALQISDVHIKNQGGDTPDNFRTIVTVGRDFAEAVVRDIKDMKDTPPTDFTQVRRGRFGLGRETRVRIGMPEYQVISKRGPRGNQIITQIQAIGPYH